MEDGPLKPILLKLYLFQSKYYNCDGVQWESNIEKQTIPSICPTKQCRHYGEFYSQQLLDHAYDALPMHRWHLRHP